MRIFHLILVLSIILFISPRLRAQESKRIVSLAASITNNLCLLEAQGNIVGYTQYCIVPGENDIPVVADAVNVNIEKVVSLKPDLVIAGGLTHPRIISSLEKMGIRTIHWRQPKDFNEICSQLEELGKICGKSDIATRHIKESRERLAKITGKITGKTRIFMEQGANPLYTVLPDSFVNDYIVLSGGENICNDLKKGVISRELVLLRDPDVIVIVSMGDMGETEKAEWEKYTTVKAVKDKRIFLVDAEEACTPTPVTFMNVLEKLANEIAGLKE